MSNLVASLISLLFLASCLLTVLPACSSVTPGSTSLKRLEIDYIENPNQLVNFKGDTLVKVPPNSAKGFNFAYYLYVPVELPKESQSVLYVEPNNTGTQNDDLEVHDKAARKFIESSYSHRIAKRLKSPMLVPVFPRLSSRWQEYTHYLNRRTIKISEGSLRRIDLQLMAMIEDARYHLSKSGITIGPKVFMNGFSSSAGFTLRFTALHPELIQANSAGGVNALPILPLKKWKGRTLRYPIGVGDFKELIGEEFNSKIFLRVPQKIYMGALDTNDTVSFRDSWDADEAEFIQQNFGEKMQPDRWEKILQIYKTTGANVFQYLSGCWSQSNS